jgi:hypothetical protein
MSTLDIIDGINDRKRRATKERKRGQRPYCFEEEEILGQTLPFIGWR